MHTGNFMLDPLADGTFDMTVIDFDNAQRSWYIIDLGTVVFEL
jgi:Ser/Thr protein kinase RdoA (MazF antagonist)